MSHIVIDVFGNPVAYRSCTLEDIDRHFNCVRRVVAKEGVEAYKERMALSIKLKSAWCVEGTDVFLYHIPRDEYVSEGVAVSVERPVEWLALLVNLKHKENLKDTLFMEFTLHSKSEVKHFKTLLTPSTLKGKLGLHKKITVDLNRLEKLFTFCGVI